MKIHYTVLSYCDEDNPEFELVASKTKAEIVRRLQEEGHKFGYKKYLNTIEVTDMVDALCKGFDLREWQK